MTMAKRRGEDRGNSAAPPEQQRLTATSISADLATARSALEACEEAVKAASQRYDAALDIGRDEALGARQVLTEAEVERDVALRAVTKIEAELALARRQEAELPRIAAYEEAKRLAAEVTEAVQEMYPLAVQTVKDLIAALAEAEAAVKAANAALPEGASPLPGVEAALRAQPMVLPELISGETVEIWCRPGSARPDEIDQAQVEVINGRGMLRHKTGGSEYLVLRTFSKSIWSGIIHGYTPDRLADAVKLPELVYVASKPENTLKYEHIGVVDRDSEARQTATLADKLSGRV